MDSSLSQHACEAAATGRSGSGNDTMMTRRAAAPNRLQLHHLREELQRGVRFAHQQEEQQQDEEEDATMPTRHYASSARTGGMRISSAFADGDDDEFSAFLGLSISAQNSHELPMPHRAASFSESSSRPRMVPCSPPVPIPQKQWQRRNSMSSTATGSRSSSSESLMIPTHDHQYSRSQCEARLWDEYWNFKLSLESRESFEASANNQRDSQESSLPRKAGAAPAASGMSHDQKAKWRATSEASTEDTVQDSGDELSGDAVEVDVFDMDDL